MDTRAIPVFGILALCGLLAQTSASAQCVVPDYNRRHAIPAGFENAPKFTLTRDYPIQDPQRVRPWDTVDFRTDWKLYLTVILDHALAELDDNLRPRQVDGKSRWFHTPWMDSSENGREFLHGLTRERPPAPQDLAEAPLPGKQGWAVGLYNEAGATVLGRVFARPCDPDPRQSLFPIGTVSVKFLFTDATPAELGWLTGSKRLQAHINPAGQGNVRKVRDVHLIQIDVSVRDKRATETGWVFGTFVFSANPLQPPAKWRDGVVPLSLQWGNDPQATPGTPIKEGFVNEALRGKHFGWEKRPYLGWHGRANGPIDNMVSSCLSCHGSAQFPRSPRYANVWTGSGQQAAMTDADKLAVYFRNIPPGDLFDAQPPGAFALDYSLQIQTALERFCRFVGNTITPRPAVCELQSQIMNEVPPANQPAARALTVRGGVER